MPTPRFLETESDDMPHSAAKGHIQFLDLTNGEGGERSDDETDDDEDDGYGGGSPSGHQELLRPHHHHLGSGNSSTGGDGSRRGDSLDEDDGGADGMDDDATSPSSLRSAGASLASIIIMAWTNHPAMIMKRQPPHQQRVREKLSTVARNIPVDGPRRNTRPFWVPWPSMARSGKRWRPR
jgi:hypothetical protein